MSSLWVIWWVSFISWLIGTIQGHSDRYKKARNEFDKRMKGINL